MAGWYELLGVFDLETTGVDPSTSRIVSAHVGVIDERGEVVRRHDWLADPGVEIPEQASAVHGITNARAKAEGRPAAAVIYEIVGTLRDLFVRGIPVVVYNAPYDLTLLEAESRRHGIAPLEDPSPIVDPLVMDKAIDRYRKGKRTLGFTAEHYGVSLDDAHDAGADAIAAGRVAQAMAKAYPAELGIPALDLHQAQAGWFADQAASFQEFRRGKYNDDYVAPTNWPIR